MRYSADEFLELIEAVEAQGGTHLPERHTPEVHMYEMPTLPPPGSTHPSTPGRRREEVPLTGCGEEALFLVVYDPATPVRVRRGHPDATTPKARIKQIEKLPETTDKSGPLKVEKQLKRGAGFVRVCAVDDAMGLWPRFANRVGESEE